MSELLHYKIDIRLHAETEHIQDQRKVRLSLAGAEDYPRGLKQIARELGHMLRLVQAAECTDPVLTKAELLKEFAAEFNPDELP